jgi:hypothetical protein
MHSAEEAALVQGSVEEWALKQRERALEKPELQRLLVLAGRIPRVKRPALGTARQVPGYSSGSKWPKADVLTTLNPVS